jgi:D-alanyl-D-alanine carboxypeptidase/D-alanyl-D-alanine-endopeptidase (penicillin-binding protein 4)
MLARLFIVVAVLLAPPAAGAPNDTLPASVQAALNVRKVPHDTLSVHVQDLETGNVVLSWLDDTPRNPGSTIKLLTTLAALDILGPTYQWQTNVYALGDIEDGRLEGDLLLEGRGDPFLVTERVWQMLRSLRQAGIRDVSGKLLLDDSFFAVPEHDPAEFDRQPLRAYNVAPNALMMNFKVLRFWFEPEHATRRVRVWLDPAIANLEIDNRLRLVTGPCRGYQRGITIVANDAMDRISLSGRFPDGCDAYRMDRTALSHNAYVYGLVESLWRESGGRLDGGWSTAPAPEDAEPLIEFRSLPLADVITRVNKHSNNVMARHLLYTLSAEVLGEPGTESGGRKVIGDWLEQNGLELSALALDNGAGLSREARMAARDFGALLRYAWRRPTMPEFVASMSLSGLDGTLSRRFRGSPITGNAHLKTGSLDHVSAIAGYLQSRSGRRFSVVMLHNHTDIHRGPGEEVQEALLRWLFEQ